MKKTLLSILLLMPFAACAMNNNADNGEITFSWAQPDENLTELFKWGAKIYKKIIPEEYHGPQEHTYGYIQAKAESDLKNWRIIIMRKNEQLIGFSALEVLENYPDGVGIHTTPIDPEYKTSIDFTELLKLAITAGGGTRNTLYTTIIPGIKDFKTLVKKLGFEKDPNYTPNPALVWTIDPDALVGYKKVMHNAPSADTSESN